MIAVTNRLTGGQAAALHEQADGPDRRRDDPGEYERSEHEYTSS
jgi:hypothetical protein